MTMYPLFFFQSLLDRSKAVRRGIVRLGRLRKHLKVILDNRIAWDREREHQADEELLLHRTPDFYLEHDPTHDRYRVYPVDNSHLRTSDPCLHYRHSRGLAHELVHVLDHSHPNLLSQQSVSWYTRQFSFDEERSASSLLARLDLASFEDDDADRTLREIIAEDAALLLLAPPRDFGQALRCREMTNVDIARHFSISVDDVRRYVQVLLMSTREELARVEISVADLQAYLLRPGYDPITAFVNAVASDQPLPEVPTVDAPQFDLDLEALELVRGLSSIVRQHLALSALRPASPSSLSILVEHFVRRHSGSELRFMLRRVSPAPLIVALQLLARRDPASYVACAGLICIKLGRPNIAARKIESYSDHKKEPRLLGILASAYLSMRDSQCDAKAHALYLRAHDLDRDDPEIRFGLAKCLMKLESLEEAEQFLLQLPGLRHWLENYLLGKIHFLRHAKSLSPEDLAKSEHYLLRALESEIYWPPRIIEFVDTDNRADWLSPVDFLDIDGDRKKAINLLAKVTEIRSRSEKNPALTRWSWILLRKSWSAHKLDSKTNFCLYEFHKNTQEPSKALLRLRELLHLRPDDLNVWMYLRDIIMKNYPQWRDYGEGITRAIRRLESNKRGANGGKDR